MKIPANVQRKADSVLTKAMAGLIHPRKTKRHGHYSLEVGRDWRLLSKDGGKTYELMSHEVYNKQIDRK